MIRTFKVCHLSCIHKATLIQGKDKRTCLCSFVKVIKSLIVLRKLYFVKKYIGNSESQFCTIIVKRFKLNVMISYCLSVCPYFYNHFMTILVPLNCLGFSMSQLRRILLLFHYFIFTCMCTIADT